MSTPTRRHALAPSSLGERALPVLLLGALLMGCASEPEAPIEGPSDPLVNEGARTPPASAPPQPRSPERPRDITISIKAFPQEVLDLKVGDIVEVQLKRYGGVARGAVRLVQPRELSISAEGTSIVTRLRPEDVGSVRLLFRPEPKVVIVGDGPLNEEESWLDQWADREVLGKDPKELWSGRFAHNVPLVVERPFKLQALTFVRRTGGRAYFIPEDQPAQLVKYDQLKLVGTALGHQQRLGGQDHCFGEVYLYLMRRGREVREMYSTERLHPADLDKASVDRFMDQARVTLAVSRPDERGRHVKIVRIPARTARIYMQHLERTPDRVAMRRLRAQQDEGLKEAEARVHSLYKALGQDGHDDLDHPLTVEVRVPVKDGGLHLLAFKKEIGLD